MDYFLFLALLSAIIIDQSTGKCYHNFELGHGNVTYHADGLLFQCDPGYTLMGRPMFSCNPDGRIQGKKPFCAKKGCKDRRGHPYIRSNSLSSDIYCPSGYVAAGNTIAYCDGKNWSNQLGHCRRINTSDYSCDFEADECGWSEYPSSAVWERVSTLTYFHYDNTGPFNMTGYYMRMATVGNYLEANSLISPIYPKNVTVDAVCFRFKYFMFGRGVGSLGVSVKPVSMAIDDLKETVSLVGSNLAEWQEKGVNIDKVNEDFQIVITAKNLGKPFGDIGIDDVGLVKGVCKTGPPPSVPQTTRLPPKIYSTTRPGIPRPSIPPTTRPPPQIYSTTRPEIPPTTRSTPQISSTQRPETTQTNPAATYPPQTTTKSTVTPITNKISSNTASTTPTGNNTTDTLKPDNLTIHTTPKCNCTTNITNNNTTNKTISNHTTSKPEESGITNPTNRSNIARTAEPITEQPPPSATRPSIPPTTRPPLKIYSTTRPEIPPTTRPPPQISSTVRPETTQTNPAATSPPPTTITPITNNSSNNTTRNTPTTNNSTNTFNANTNQTIHTTNNNTNTTPTSNNTTDTLKPDNLTIHTTPKCNCTTNNTNNNTTNKTIQPETPPTTRPPPQISSTVRPETTQTNPAATYPAPITTKSTVTPITNKISSNTASTTPTGNNTTDTLKPDNLTIHTTPKCNCTTNITNNNTTNKTISNHTTSKPEESGITNPTNRSNIARTAEPITEQPPPSAIRPSIPPTTRPPPQISSTVRPETTQTNPAATSPPPTTITPITNNSSNNTTRNTPTTNNSTNTFNANTNQTIHTTNNNTNTAPTGNNTTDTLKPDNLTIHTTPKCNCTTNSINNNTTNKTIQPETPPTTRPPPQISSTVRPETTQTNPQLQQQRTSITNNTNHLPKSTQPPAPTSNNTTNTLKPDNLTIHTTPKCNCTTNNITNNTTNETVTNHTTSKPQESGITNPTNSSRIAGTAEPITEQPPPSALHQKANIECRDYKVPVTSQRITRIDEMLEDFQVIFTATNASSRFGDIAIDDVKLVTSEECKETRQTTTLTEPSETPVIPMSNEEEMMNCKDHCGQTSISGSYLNKGCG
ncbi:mucin-2 [Drosophila eugracilis]|uniref:mucin-2 n=1 Tax=Drosophila eugracilis TaxID=29029 RepID=UPI001BDA794E|nr:mucin-2 [Drosophila eugracilis]